MWNIESCRVARLGILGMVFLGLVIFCVGEACMVVACLGVHTLGSLALPARVLGDPSIDGVADACLGIAAPTMA